MGLLLNSNDKNLEFILKNMPDKNFINIIKKTNLGSLSKNLNYKYRIFLVNKLLNKKTSLKTKKVVYSEIKIIADNCKHGGNEKEEKFMLLCQNFLANDNVNFERNQQEYLTLKKDRRTREEQVDKNNIEKKNLDKKIEKQKDKIRILNEKQQSYVSDIKKLEKENESLGNENNELQKTINSQNEEIIRLHSKISKFEEKLKKEREKANKEDLNFEKLNNQLNLKIRVLQENIHNIKKENSLLKSDKEELREKILELSSEKYLLIGMPIGFKYGSIKIPEQTIFQIATSNTYSTIDDEKIIKYSTIDDMVGKLSYPIYEYSKVIIFNGEVTRRDIIEVAKKTDKNKIVYVSNLNEIEQLLKQK